MLVLLSVLVALVPAVIVLYPLVKRLGVDEFLEDESSVSAELTRRWEGALAGLKSAELELSIGTLSHEDYIWLKEQLTTEAALVMKAMDLEEQDEVLLIARMKSEIEETRARGDIQTSEGGDESGPVGKLPYDDS